MSKLKLEHIKIKNPAIWDVVKTEDFQEDDMTAHSSSQKLTERQRELTATGLNFQNEITIDS